MVTSFSVGLLIELGSASVGITAAGRHLSPYGYRVYCKTND